MVSFTQVVISAILAIHLSICHASSFLPHSDIYNTFLSTPLPTACLPFSIIPKTPSTPTLHHACMTTLDTLENVCASLDKKEVVGQGGIRWNWELAKEWLILCGNHYGDACIQMHPRMCFMKQEERLEYMKKDAMGLRNCGGPFGFGQGYTVVTEGHRGCPGERVEGTALKPWIPHTIETNPNIPILLKPCLKVGLTLVASLVSSEPLARSCVAPLSVFFTHCTQVEHKMPQWLQKGVFYDTFNRVAWKGSELKQECWDVKSKERAALLQGLQNKHSHIRVCDKRWEPWMVTLVTGNDVCL